MSAASAINSVSNATATAATSADAVAFRQPVRTLGQDDFLKLLVTQLSSQDPMNPQKDTEFIAQMASFSSLEQTRSMQSDIAGMRSEQQIQQAAALIGRSVSIKADSGELITGRVTGMNLEEKTPRIVVNGQPYALTSVLGVSAPSHLN